jgi:hypothetical protein
MPSGVDCSPDDTTVRRKKSLGNRTAQTRMHTRLVFSTSVAHGAADGAMEAFLQVEAAHASTVWDEKVKSKWRRLCFQVHAGRQGVVDRWVSHLARQLAARCWRGARAGCTRLSVATLQRRWELCSMRCGSVSRRHGGRGVHFQVRVQDGGEAVQGLEQ